MICRLSRKEISQTGVSKTCIENFQHFLSECDACIVPVISKNKEGKLHWAMQKCNSTMALKAILGVILSLLVTRANKLTVLYSRPALLFPINILSTPFDSCAMITFWFGNLVPTLQIFTVKLRHKLKIYANEAARTSDVTIMKSL